MTHQERMKQSLHYHEASVSKSMEHAQSADERRRQLERMRRMNEKEVK